MTDPQRRGIEWREAVLRELDTDLIAKKYHGKVLVTLDVRDGAIVGIEQTFSVKSLRPEEKRR